MLLPIISCDKERTLQYLFYLIPASFVLIGWKLYANHWKQTVRSALVKGYFSGKGQRERILTIARKHGSLIVWNC